MQQIQTQKIVNNYRNTTTTKYQQLQQIHQQQNHKQQMVKDMEIMNLHIKLKKMN